MTIRTTLLKREGKRVYATANGLPYIYRKRSQAEGKVEELTNHGIRCQLFTAPCGCLHYVEIHQ